MTDVQLVMPGRPSLMLADTGARNGKYRYRARLRGRSLGGYAVGSGPTQEAAIDNLIEWYRGEIEAVEAGRKALAEWRKR